MAPHTFDPNAEHSGDDALVRNPDATPADLHRLAAERPDLRPLIANHPNVYPELRDWLASVSEPEPAEESEPAAQPQPSDRDAELVRDPETSASDLHRIAGERPDLRGAIAAHPNAYPDLLTWLGTWNDPEINEALAAREDAAAPDESPKYEDRTAVLGSGAAILPATDAGATAEPPTQRIAPQRFEPAQQQGPRYDAPVAAAPAAHYTPSEPQRSGSVASSVVLGALIGLVVILLAVVLMLWRPWESNDPVAAPTTSAPAPSATESASPTETASPTESPTPSESPTETETPAMPYLPEGAASVTHFTAPSGNIACRSDGDQAFTCTIYDHNITDADGQGLNCEGPLTIHWPYASEPDYSCEATVAKGSTTLQYGASALLGQGIACTSEQVGISCWDGESGLGVQLARRGISSVNKAG